MICQFDALSEIDQQRFIQAAVSSYIELGTFGEFPKDDPIESEQLMAIMSIVSPGTVVVSLEDRDSGQHVGGCFVVPGNGSELVVNMVGREDSSLSTFWALDFDICSLPLDLQSASEYMATSFSRFHRVPDSDLSLKMFSMEVLSGMARAVNYLNVKAGREVVLGILDTHDPNVVKVLEKYYGGHVLSTISRPTPHVGATPLRWHYDPEIFNFSVIYFDCEEQIRLAMEVDASLGKKIDK